MTLDEQRRALMDAYRRTLSGEDGSMVLRDLAQICNFSASTVGLDPHETYLNEGRRQVYLYVLAQMSMTPEALDDLAAQPDFEPFDSHFHDITEDNDG